MVMMTIGIGMGMGLGNGNFCFGRMGFLVFLARAGKELFF